MTELNVKYEAFAFEHNGQAVEAEICVVDVDGVVKVSVDGLYPQDTIIDDLIVKREYYIWKDTQMTEWGY